MEPLMIGQLGLGAIQGITGLLNAMKQKGVPLTALNQNIAQKQENARRKKEAEDRARIQAQQGFNPNDLSQMNQQIRDSANVGNANMAGMSTGQRMAGTIANNAQTQKNTNQLFSSNANKKQENERYLDNTIAQTNQAQNQVSDANLDKFQVESERAQGAKQAAYAGIGSGLNNLMGGLKGYQNQRDWAKMDALRKSELARILGYGETPATTTGATTTSTGVGATVNPYTAGTQAQTTTTQLPYQAGVGGTGDALKKLSPLLQNYLPGIGGNGNGLTQNSPYYPSENPNGVGAIDTNSPEFKATFQNWMTQNYPNQQPTSEHIQAFQQMYAQGLQNPNALQGDIGNATPTSQRFKGLNFSKYINNGMGYSLPYPTGY